MIRVEIRMNLYTGDPAKPECTLLFEFSCPKPRIQEESFLQARSALERWADRFGMASAIALVANFVYPFSITLCLTRP